MFLNPVLQCSHVDVIRSLKADLIESFGTQNAREQLAKLTRKILGTKRHFNYLLIDCRLWLI